MASTSASGDNTSSEGCISPTYDSDGKSDSLEESHVAESNAFHICPACKQPFSDPRVLDCLHSFCYVCLKKMMVNENTREIKCMICQRTTRVEQDQITIDYGRRRFIERLTFNHDDNVICRSCKMGKPAISRCVDCATFLCDICTPHHSTLYCFHDHRVYDLQDSFQHPEHDTGTLCAVHAHCVATGYCTICCSGYCHAAEHHHKLTNLPWNGSSCSQEMLFSIDMERTQIKERMSYYTDGIQRMDQHRNIFLDDLEKRKNELMEAINRRYLALQDLMQQDVMTRRETARQLLADYTTFDNQLHNFHMFLSTQSKNALVSDNAQIRPFAERLLQNINNLKPQFVQLSFNFELLGSGNPDDLAQYLGSLCYLQDPREQQTVGYRQQQPIARPTTMNRSVNQNYTNNESYQIGGYDGSSNYRQYTSLNQTNVYTSSSSQPHDVNRASGYFAIEQRCQQRNTYDPQFTCQRSSTSPMATSQPNSASLVSGDVFQFNKNDGINGNYTNSFSAQNQNRPYQSWSDGYDQPGNAGAQQPDIFSQSTLFQVPGSAPGSSRYGPVKRLRMTFISKFGEYGNSKGQFTEPSGVAIDGNGRLIVADTNNNRIQIFDIHGRYLSHFGPDPANNNELNKLTFPNRIAVSKRSGTVVITERSPSHRVQTYTIKGEHLNTFGDDVLQHPRGVAIDEDDNIVVIECKVMRVTIFTMAGKKLAQFSLSKELQFPNSIAVHNNEIFISDNRGHNVKVFDYEGHMLRTIGQEGVTNYPIAVAINQRGQVVVADNHNNFNITIFEKDGTLVGGFESKTKHAQCFDLAVTDDGLAVLTSKDYKVYCYPYQEDSHHYIQNQRR